MNLCIYCERIDKAVAEELRVCPKCGRDLSPQPASPPAVRRVESFHAHAVEARYSDAAVKQTGAPVEHDAHEVLAYARALVEIVLAVERFTADERERSAVLGFMTGSEPLDWLLRRRLGHLFEKRIAHVRGLRHKMGGADPDAELFAKLDDWLELGVRRIVVVDEVVGGTQLRTAFLRMVRWHKERGTPSIAVHLTAVSERAPEGVEERQAWFHETVLKGDDRARDPSMSLSFEVIATPRLLGKDGAGQPIKDAVLSDDGSYDVLRLWPAGYAIRCPNRLTLKGGADLEVIFSEASLDQLFGVLIYAVCGFGYVAEGRWPETIKRAGCEDCKGLLHQVRGLADRVARAVPSPESVHGRVVGPPDVRLVGPNGESVSGPETGE